jgi:hypothetical protein
MNDNETPFMDIDIITKDDKHNIRLYKTKPGLYGVQVVSIIRQHTTGKTQVFTDKTNGYGYSKQAEALTQAFELLGVTVPGYTEHSESLPYEMHIGGNYYKVTIE